MLEENNQKIIKEAKKWIGYLEHKTNEQLNLYTSNVGKGGCTIFSWIICRYYPRFNFSGLPWCAAFIYAIYIIAYGKEYTKKLFGKPCAGTKLLVRRLKRKKSIENANYIPNQGDLIFFHNGDGKISHCGIVEGIEEDMVVTIEGNTIDPSGHFKEHQGGAVALRKRKLSDSAIICYANLQKLKSSVGYQDK